MIIAHAILYGKQRFGYTVLNMLLLGKYFLVIKTFVCSLEIILNSLCNNLNLEVTKGNLEGCFLKSPGVPPLEKDWLKLLNT